jgi:hypothetical protein
LNQGFGCGRQHLATGSRYYHHILNSDSELTRQINSGLNCDYHPRQQPVCLASPNARRLMYFQADSVAAGVGKRFSQSSDS